MSYSNNMEFKDLVALDVIYKKKYIFGFAPISGTELLNLSKFSKQSGP